METKDALVAEFKATFEAFKGTLDESRAEVKKAGEVSAETALKMTRIEQRIDELETKLRRMPLSYDGADPEAPEAVKARKLRDIYFKILRHGGMGILEDDERQAAIEAKMYVGPKEAKALALGDDTTGGFLAPSDYVAEIIKGVQLMSPIREIARVRPTTRRSVMQPVRSGVFAAQWVGETATRSETTGLTYSMEEIPTYEAYAEVIVSEQDLEDSAFDLEAEIRSESAEQLAKAEGTAFVSGDSVRKPEGFMTNAAVSHDFSGATAAPWFGPTSSGTASSADGLIKLYHNLKEAYATNAVWVMNRATMGLIRRLVDADGHPLLVPDLQAGGQYSLMGARIVQATDMPDTANTAFPVAFGDFRRGYLIVDRVDMVIKRLNEKYAESGQIAFIVRKRVGGQVILPEAIRKLEIASS